jgi:hypothetical protein
LLTLVSVPCPRQVGTVEAGVLPLGRVVGGSSFWSGDELVLVRFSSFGDTFLESSTDKVAIDIGLALSASSPRVLPVVTAGPVTVFWFGLSVRTDAFPVPPSKKLLSVRVVVTLCPSLSACSSPAAEGLSGRHASGLSPQLTGRISPCKQLC